jgi:hypothetical protein
VVGKYKTSHTCPLSNADVLSPQNNYHPGQAIQKAVGVAAYNKLFGPGSLGLVDGPDDE